MTHNNDRSTEVDLARMRAEYENAGLNEADFGDDPMVHFGQWLEQAHAGGLIEPNAMVLSTTDPDGLPDARLVLCKGISSGGVEGRLGVEFYTNYNSAKGQQLGANSWAAVTFAWLGLHRQLLMRGVVEKMTAEESDRYFSKRPSGSRIGAMVSDQSSVLEDRSVLEAAFAAAQDSELLRPDHWGGYRLVPTQIEFWQGRPSRLHDRIHYSYNGDGNWLINRLAP